MSNKMTQKEAVFQAIINVMGNRDGAYVPSKEERAQVSQILIEGFTNGLINYDGEVPTDKKLRDYVSGLQSNWLRKDTRLNGGVAYVAKNPGSRTGSTDPQIKAMRALLAAKTDTAERAEIQTFIDKRLAELKPAKTVTVNIADLPAELQAKYSK
jgi:hypothetical protein